MTTLYVLREWPDLEDFEILEAADADDPVLLLQEAVRAQEEFDGEEVHASLYDLRIRDLDPAPGVEEADYDDVADLIAEHDRVVSL